MTRYTQGGMSLQQAQMATNKHHSGAEAGLNTAEPASLAHPQCSKNRLRALLPLLVSMRARAWFALAMFTVTSTWAAGPGDSVVVVYNKNLAESKKVAQHYADKRGVPSSQLFGADVSAASEVISRPDFHDKLQKPLFDWLVKEKLFTPNAQPPPAKPDPAYHYVSGARVRYIVLCYGIPLKIARDPNLKEEGGEKLQEALRGRNEAAVDADLALLPTTPGTLPLNGPLPNPFYLSTNAALLHPTNGLVLVARLDGPTADIANKLVDKAMQAESEGLWGRGYFDIRGLTNGEYKLGDDWIRSAADITRRLGIEVSVDQSESTFSAGFPMSHVAIYAGWYDSNASGPFAQPTVEFMPGAFAYHLHSFSAATLRSTTQNWVGPLLAKGATITFGSVDEPYLTGTPNVAAFIERLVYRRFNFAEAAYTSQSLLSWQTTVIGDPLYRPFGLPPDELHFKLEKSRNPLLAWSHLKVVGLNEATGLPPAEALKYLEQIPLTKQSAVLMEKSGEIERAQQHFPQALEKYAAALKLKPSPQQKLRLLMLTGDLQAATGHEQAAVEAYKQILKDFPDYPNAVAVYQGLAGLSRKLGKTQEAESFDRQAQAGAKK